MTICTIQRLYSMLRGEELAPDTDANLDEHSAFELAAADSRPKDVAYNPALPIETFDFIVTDECHRSIYNLWRQVLEYFDAHLIGDRAFVVVLHHEVLVEEADGLLRRCRGQAEEGGVEVFEDLAPEAVDGAVALVGDDEVEGLDGDAWVVGDVLRAVVGGGELEGGLLVEVLFQLLAAEHGVEALDGADGHAADVVELVRLEVLDVVDLGELPAGVGRYELVELPRGLLA